MMQVEVGHPVQGINAWHGFRELQCYSQLLRSVRHVLVMDEQVTRCETSSATTEMAQAAGRGSQLIAQLAD